MSKCKAVLDSEKIVKIEVKAKLTASAQKDASKKKAVASAGTTEVKE